MTYAEFKKAFYAAKDNDPQLQAILAQIESGKGVSFKLASRYAGRIGLLSSTFLSDAVGVSLTWDEAVESLFPSLCLVYGDSATVAAQVQQAVNAGAGTRIKAITPQVNKKRIFNLMEKLVDPEQEADFLLGGDVISNLSRSAVTDTIEENAKFASEAGLHSYISRSSPSGCCEWCDSVSGTFEIGKEPDGFWQIHKDCNCVIDYRPSKTKWSRIQFRTEGGKLRKDTSNL